ncbi:metal-dependent hydrolase [Ideonella sp. YS5]|uniref:metal-dependent hydrolase n=1 Tax=Ideonella sp. YS5 TaxID=3453714 RepID=UPI003EEAD321
MQPRRYWNGNALRTRLFDGLSLLLPAGEEFVIRAAQDWLDTHPDADPRLRAEAGRFIREERSHQRAHRRYNAELHDAIPVAREAEQGVTAAVGELDRLGLRMRLALAAAFEHLTALLSAEVLRGEAWVDDTPRRECRMWRWHCAEELAHQHVAGDLLRSMGPLPGQRILALVLASVYLAGDAFSLTWTLCRHELRQGFVGRRELLAQAGRFAWRAFPGLCRIARGWGGQWLPAAR